MPLKVAQALVAVVQVVQRQMLEEMLLLEELVE
jgi:hypothetical protein